MLKEVYYPGFSFKQKYMIDTFGNIYTPYRGFHKMTYQKIKKGYFRVHLSTDKGSKFFMVHRLVLATFSPTEGMENLQVNHIDGNKENNQLSNLEWCDGKYNIRHAAKIGLRDNMQRGEEVKNSVLTEEQVIEIYNLIMDPNHDSYSKIGSRYGVSKYAVHDIKRRKSWKWLIDQYISESSTTSAKARRPQATGGRNGEPCFFAGEDIV